MKMGGKLKRVLFGGLCVPLLLSSGIALAQTETTTDTDNTSLAQRLADRKARLQTKLTTAQQVRLKARCKAAQGLLNPMREKVAAIQKNRVNAYDALSDQLNSLITKVGDKADTTELKTELDTYHDKVNDFETSLNDYKQAVSDLVDVDCVSDPAAFKASLDSARTLLTDARTKAADIRTYVTDTIKPSLQKLRDQLRSKQGAVIN